MANITDQFVTSFSELYIGDQSQTGKSFTLSTGFLVRNFFNGTSGASSTTAATSVPLTADVSNVLALTAISPSNGTILSITDPATNALVHFKVTGSSVTIPAVTAGGTARTLESVAGITGVNFYSARVPLVMEIGTLSNEATVIDTPTFGEVFKGKLRGQLDGGQLDAQLYWAPRDFVHKLVREYAQDGTATLCGIKWTNASGDSADAEYVIFDSFVSSFGIDTAFDDVAKASATMVVDGSEVFAGDTGA